MTMECIDSIIKQTKGITFEIILVDNASTDGSREFFSQDTRITYVYNESNLGFGKANNCGAKLAKGRYLFLLNSDTLLVNNAVKMFVDYMDSKPISIGCCGAFLENSNGEIIHSYGRLHTFSNVYYEYIIYPVLSHIKYYENGKYTPDTTQNEVNDVGYITGADLFLRKKIFDECGLFDEDFFMYSEDMDLCKRYSDAGYISVIFKGPRIIHLVGYSNDKRKAHKKLIFIKSSLLYLKKHNTPISYSIFLTIFKYSYIAMMLISFPFIKWPTKDKWQHIKDILSL